MHAAHLCRFALRGLVRDARGGELGLLALALVIAVAATAAVGFFTDRIRGALERQGAELLAADLVLAAPAPLPADFEREAAARGLAVARTLSFPSVVLAGERSALAEVKAAGAGYPLRGQLAVSDAPFGDAVPTAALPAPGTVWLDERLLAALGVGVGARIELGAREFTVVKVLAFEPDRGGELFSIAPRLLMALDDMASTQLVQTGSRVQHRLGLAGEPEAVAAYRAWTAPRLPVNAQVQGLADARPELRAALERAQRFLGLASVVAVIVAGVGIAIAARRFAARHRDAVAVLRTLGATQGAVAAIYALELALLGLAAGLLGAALGFGAQAGLTRLLGALVGGALPPASIRPLPAALATGLLALLGFALPPILSLRRVSPLRVLRRDLPVADGAGIGTYAAAAVAVAGLVLWQADEARLAALVFGGLAAALVLLALVAWALLQGLARLRGRVGVAWRFGFTNVARRGPASVAQVVALGAGLMALLVLTLVRSDLLAEWRASLPADAPNRFLINIQPDEVAPLRDFLHRQGSGEVTLYPMVRGRLTRVDGRAVSAADYPDDPRAQRLVEREFNLSWADTPQPDNRIVAGRWWTPAERGRALVSVEQGLAQTLGLALGDRLRFEVAGEAVEAEVASLRSVEWDSFNVNFFVVFPPGVIEALPGTWITSFHLPAARNAVLLELVRAFPSVTVLDVDALMQRVRGIIERVTQAVEYVFLFTLAAGFTVLAAAVQATRDERRFESAIVRTLGAPRAVVLKGLLAEFALLGLTAGLLAAFAASLLGWVLAERVFHFAYAPSPVLWLIGALAGTLGVSLAGLAGTRAVLDQPPLRTLREG